MHTQDTAPVPPQTTARTTAAKPEPLKISLVIPAYNEEKWILPCLESALVNSAGLLHQIIVVDNASTDKTGELANNVPRVEVLREGRKGTSAARQRGFEASTGDLVAFIDADCRLTPGWCEKILHEFGNNPKLAALSGPYVYYDMPAWQRALVKIFWHTLAYPFYMMTKYMSMGGNLVIKRSVLEKMGGLDTSITFYGDDTDMVRRASKFGQVKFKFSFTIESSARRFHSHGMVKTGFTYILNFFSQVVAKKSVTKNAEHTNR